MIITTRMPIFFFASLGIDFVRLEPAKAENRCFKFVLAWHVYSARLYQYNACH
jgi:hypothetical protein